MRICVSHVTLTFVKPEKIDTLGMIGRVRFAGPGHYKIVAQGRLSPAMSDRFGSMRVVAAPAGVDASVAVLEGRVSDQAELSGILNTLFELHFSLLSVSCLEGELHALDR